MVKFPSLLVMVPLIAFFSPCLNKVMVAYSRGRFVEESITFPVIFAFLSFSFFCAKPGDTVYKRIKTNKLFFNCKILIVQRYFMILKKFGLLSTYRKKGWQTVQ